MLAGVYLKEDTQKYTAGFTNRMCFTNRLKAMLFKCEKKSYTCIKKKILHIIYKVALLCIFALFRRWGNFMFQDNHLIATCCLKNLK